MSMLHQSSIGTLFKALLITALLAAPAALCAADNAPAPATKQPSVDELIARNIEAHGGLTKMKAVQSVRMTGKMTMGQGMEAPMTLELKRPKNMRMEFTFQGMTGIQAYDGKDGWQVMPFMGSKDPEPMTTEDLQEAEEQADMDGPLVDYKAKGYKVELLGKEKIEGSDAWKLKVTMKTGERIIYLDADTMLEIKTEGKRTVRGSEMEFETSLGDYREVGGLLFAFSIEVGAKGHPEKQNIVVDKVELNPALDASRYKMPAVAKAADPAAAPPAGKTAPSKPPATTPGGVRG
jgi:hypothetical protein